MIVALETLISPNVPGLKWTLTIYGARGAGGVVSKGLVAVSIIRLVLGIEGQLEARGAVLDKDDELLVNESSGRLHREAHATPLSVHPEPRRDGQMGKSGSCSGGLEGQRFLASKHHH